MATKQEKELTVEERLKALYQLQTLLSEVDRIKTLRGELPLEVQDLEDEIAGLETRVANYDSSIKEMNDNIRHQRETIVQAQALIDKYKKVCYNNNVNKRKATTKHTKNKFKKF